jgi:hypothetical protein
MATPENDMDCDELFRLTVDGPDRLDDVTRARCDEHAKGCEECRSHLEGLAAWDDAVRNPGKYPRTSPEVRAKILELAREHAAKEASGSSGPRIFPILFILVLAGAAAFYAHQATQPRPELAPIELPATRTVDKAVTLGGPVESSLQWLAKADDLIKDGHPEEARKWLEKVLDDKYATRETKAEARKKLEGLGKPQPPK